MPMEEALSLRALMQKPFGPYNHIDILSKEFYEKSSPSTLHSVRIFNRINGNYEDTGLSKTELLNTSAPAKDVYFTGVLDIEDRRWLSPEGIKLVEGDILRRDQSIHRPKAYSKQLLKLKALYAHEHTFKSRNPTVKVLIKCKKCVLASFLTRTRHPDALVLVTPTTEDKRTCDFIVESMHVKTHQMSERFLNRYRLYATVVDIVNNGASVPREERTMQWLVSRIKEDHYSRTRKRIIANAVEDSDYDEDGTTLRVPRRPRHLSSAEVMGVLAKEAPWLLAQQLSRQPPKPDISITSLYAFCLEYSRIRPRATGQWKSVKARDLQQICMRYLVVDSKTFNKRLDYQTGKELEASVLQMPGALDVSEFESQDEEPNFAAPGGFEVDSDASVASSSEASGSDAEGPAIPTRHFNLAPFPPAAGEIKWFCPRKRHGCPFKIDLYELAETNGKGWPNITRLAITYFSGNANALCMRKGVRMQFETQRPQAALPKWQREHI